MNKISFLKSKSNIKTAIIFTSICVVTFISSLLFTLTSDMIIPGIIMLITAGLAYRYFSYHKHTYIKYDQANLYVYRGIFKKLKAIKLSSIAVVMVMGNKIRLLTQDGLEITLNCLEISKTDGLMLLNYLKSHINKEKWAH